MKRLWKLSILAACALLAGAVSAEEMAGNTQFLIGQRYLDDSWKPLDEPSMFGVEVDFAPAQSPVHVALGGFLSSDKQHVSTPFYGSTGSVEVDMLELSAGFLWHPLRRGVVRPYVGAGIVRIYAAIDSEFGFFGSSENDESFGFYGNGGLFFKVGERFNIGIDGRVVRGTKLDFSGTETNGNYEQVALLLGFSWGN